MFAASAQIWLKETHVLAEMILWQTYDTSSFQDFGEDVGDLALRGEGETLP